ncbi:PAS domain-containing protein [Bradyrhizobium oligotrophicum]|uniref:PAS domain-containing protein n=1 Tax=Bradyrhizobium oligotrophicum TaxID=44255 RepID=UPI003EB9C4CE
MIQPQFLSGGGEMGAYIRAYDWSTHPLGRPEAWPQSLKTAVRLLLNTGHPAYIFWGPAGYCFYNDAYRPSIGFERHPGSIGRPAREVWDEIWPIIGPQIEQVMSGRGATWHENQLVPITRDGELRDVYWTYSYSPIDDQDAVEGVGGVLVMCTETTEQVLAAQRLAEERRRQHLLLRQMPGFVCVLTGSEHRYEYVNDAYRTIAGDRDFLGRTVREVLPELAEQGFYDLLDHVNASGERFVARAMPISLARDDGERFIDFLYEPVRNDTGEVTGIFVGGYDVTEQVRAIEHLRVNEERYRTLFEAIQVGFCIIEMMPDDNGKLADYRFLEVNPAFERQSGLRDVLGCRMRDLIPDHEQFWFEFYGRVATTGEQARTEFGSSSLGRWWDVHAFRVGAPEQRRVASLFSDISDRRRAELALQDLNEKLESHVAERTAERNLLARIVETTDAQIQVIDHEYRWLAINKSCAEEYVRIYGKLPSLGQSLLEFLADRPEQKEAAKAGWDRALSGEAFTTVGEFGDVAIVRRFYEMKFEPLADEQGAQIGAFLIGRDISERTHEQRRLAEAEEALRQSQKMEAMGQLTGGVAHDFNNLLTPIVGTLDMLQRRHVGGEREQRLIGGAIQSAERARTLVQRLLAFARRQPLQLVSVDVAQLVHGMADLIRSTTGPQIDVVIDAPGDLPPARVDSHQVEMALLNLSVNARDAMPSGGTLRITASVSMASPTEESILQPGRYVRLSVVDSGLGMDPDTLKRAVEPFFSTKGVGKGTGLGLSMVHGLVSQLGGALTISSVPGAGTNVELWLPMSDDMPETLSSTRAIDRKAQGTVLLVDDEDLVRLSTADMLADLGFDVVEATSAEQAMRIIRSESTLDLIVTDHLMPGMTGVHLARQAQAFRPRTPILIISGYADGTGIEADLPRLMKPFVRDELVASLANLVAFNDQ